jgi:hypothetical protein
MGETLQPVKNAARRFGISVWTIRKRAYEGDVASVKIGAKLLSPKLSDKFKKRCAPRRVARPVRGEHTKE